MAVTELRPRSFDVPGSRDCIDTMQRWLDGEPVWPYNQIIEAWGREFMDWRVRWRELAEERTSGADVNERTKLRLGREMALYEVRMEYVGRFGFAIPCRELIDALIEAAPVVEVGAGSGYMTRLMRNAGIDVVGSDIDDHKDDSGHGFIVAEHDPEQVSGVEAKTMARRHPERTVFCSWPSYKETWFRQMLRAMRIGQKVIVIREDCCADETAWHYLDACFEPVAEIELPCFPMVHDYAGVYVKRRQDAQSKNRAALLGRRRALPRRAGAKHVKRTSKAA
jgi:hypothetical protein